MYHQQEISRMSETIRSLHAIFKNMRSDGEMLRGSELKVQSISYFFFFTMRETKYSPINFFRQTFL